MTALVQRYFVQSPRERADMADRIVFVATTGLCALGALVLPLVG
jgi:hypothetical protein